MLCDVQITQDDIDQGVILDCDLCPAALALGRLMKPGAYVGVVTDHVYFGATSTSIHGVYSPVKLIFFVTDFDSGKTVKPMMFPINIPDELLRVPQE